MNTPNQDALVKRVLEMLEVSMEMDPQLDSNEDLYDLPYIRKHLTAITRHQITLSNFNLELMKLNMAVTHAASSAKSLLKIEETKFRNSAAYIDAPRERKTPSLSEHLESFTDKATSWGDTKKLLSDIREAIDERMNTLRRLDSNLRLHVKMLEVGGSNGANTRDGNTYDPFDRSRDVTKKSEPRSETIPVQELPALLQDGDDDLDIE